MLIKKVIFVNVMAITLILMTSTAFAAKLTINSDTHFDELIIGDGDEVEVSGAYTVDVDGDVTIATTGILDMGNGASVLQCAGTFTNNGTLTAHADSQITFDGVAQSITGSATSPFAKVLFSGGQKTFNGNASIATSLDTGGQDVVISGGVTLTLGAGSSTTISGGAWTLTGATLTCDATSTINYTSGIAQDVLAVNHGHLTHDGAGTLSLTTDLFCDGLLTNTTGDFTPGAFAITAGGIVWINGSVTATPSGVWDIGASGVDINGGTFIATSGTFTCGGNWDMTGTGIFTAGTGTVEFDGAGLTIKCGTTNKFKNVSINENATLAGNMLFLTTGTLTVVGTKKLDLESFALTGETASTTLSNNGTVEADGSQTITLVNWDSANGTTLINGTGGVTLTNFADSFHDLDIGGDDAIALGKDITVAGDIEVLTAGTTFNMATHSIELTGGGTVTNNGTWAVPTAGTFTCLGSATFAGNDVNFYDFSCIAENADLTFAATKTYQVDGTLTLNGGGAGTRIDIMSDASGSAFIIQNDGGTENVQFVSVQDCEATVNPIDATSSTKGTNVINWIFSIISAASGGDWSVGATWVGGVVPDSTDDVTIAGDVTLDTSPITINDLTVQADKTLACGANTITVNGASDINGTITISTGTYDAGGNFDATAGTITFSGTGTLSLGGETVISLGTFTAGNSTVDYNRTDAQTVPADTYNNLTISGGSDAVKTLDGAIVINSDLSIAASTELNVSGSNFAISVAGNWSNSGTFTAQSGAVTFTGGAAQLLTPGASSFYDLTINKTGGADTVTPDASGVSVTNDLTLTDGEFMLATNNPNVTISHALSIADGAVWTAGTGTLIFNGDDCTLSDANDPPNNLGNVKVE